VTTNHLIEKLRGFISQWVPGGDMSAPLGAAEMDDLRRELPGFLDHEFASELGVDQQLEEDDADDRARES
jgi:hypothetical protein